MEYVQYSDWDMKMMAFGEVGAHLMALLLAVASWLFLDGAHVIVKIAVAIVVFAVAWWASLAFVHIGYNPDEQVRD